jgi:hypothetical protein
VSSSKTKRRYRKPTQLQLSILFAAADLSRFIYDRGNVVALLCRHGLADADCSSLDEMDKEQLRRIRDDYGLPTLRSLD